jgi:predicted GNAT family N-acyltransferase
MATPDQTDEASGVTVIIVTNDQQRDDSFAVRLAVFVEEQGIAREDELDEFDSTATHCVAYDAAGMPVAAGRLHVQDDTAKIGRMSVLASHRGGGTGARVLAALEREGARRGVRLFKLSAQIHARGFYERCGYTAYGELYDDVGIPHIDMKKTISR